jgi:hypothetical protein
VTMLLHILIHTIKTKSALCVVRRALPLRCALNLNIAPPSVVAANCKKNKHRKYRNCDRLSQLSQRDSYAVERHGTELACWWSTEGKASPKRRRWRDQVVGARAPTGTQRQPLSNSRKYKAGATAPMDMKSSSDMKASTNMKSVTERTRSRSHPEVGH